MFGWLGSPPAHMVGRERRWWGTQRQRPHLLPPHVDARATPGPHDSCVPKAAATFAVELTNLVDLWAHQGLGMISPPTSGAACWHWFLASTEENLFVSGLNGARNWGLLWGLFLLQNPAISGGRLLFPLPPLVAPGRGNWGGMAFSGVWRPQKPQWPGYLSGGLFALLKTQGDGSRCLHFKRPQFFLPCSFIYFILKISTLPPVRKVRGGLQFKIQYNI